MRGMASSDTPTLPSLGVSIIGDNFLVAEDFESLKDENCEGFDWLSMRPHCRIRLQGEIYGLDESFYMRNFSKPGLTLQELGELVTSAKWDLNCWLTEWQLITILQVGAEDLLRGQRITKETFQDNPKLILNMVRKAILNLVAIKSEYLQKLAPEKVEFWKHNHHFGIYLLPNLKNYPFDGTRWTFDEYTEVRRKQNNSLKNSKDQKHLKYTVLRPNISNPSFSNRKNMGFPGFPYMKLEKNFMKPFVDPILRLVAQKFCSRCKEPTLQKNLWEKATVSPANGQYSSVHRIPDEIWNVILKKLTPFDVWCMKETCKGLYRIHHQSLRCVENIVLEREKNRL